MREWQIFSVSQKKKKTEILTYNISFDFKLADLPASSLKYFKQWNTEIATSG